METVQSFERRLAVIRDFGAEAPRQTLSDVALTPRVLEPGTRFEGCRASLGRAVLACSITPVPGCSATPDS